MRVNLRIGSLFSGYGGLDMAVQQTLGGDLAWYSEIEPAACTVLAAHHPGVANLGDITAVDWSQVEPVDILTGGYPCQPFSHAGQRKGKADERHLWPYVAAAIGALGPRLVVLENVAGHLSLGLADVLGDLASLGYDARWLVVRAADAGAPHGRARVFIAAYPHGAGLEGHGAATLLPQGQGRRGADRPAAQSDHVAPPHPDGGGHGREQDAAGVGRVDGGDAGPSRQRQRARGESDAGGAGATADAGDRALAQRPRQARRQGGQRPPVGGEPGGGSRVNWGRYAPAIARWERLTRPAPAPTIPGTNGRPRLSPRFVEWMMGLPEGHVTGHGLRPAQCLKQLGNGVVWQQGALALRLLLGLPVAAVEPFDGRLIGTPQAGLGEGGGVRSPEYRAGRAPTPQELIEELALLPTPVADHSRGLAQPGSDYQSLPNVAISLLPIPKAGDGERGRDLPRMRPDEKSRELSTAVAFMGDEDGAA